MSGDFEIDPEIHDYMFAPDKLCDEELEQELLANGGPRDALIVAELPDGKRFLVDGHRRHKLCLQHHLKFDTHVKLFESREAVFDFMDGLQLSRRNLNTNQMSLLRARRKQRHESELGHVAAAEEAAAVHGVSPRSIYRDVAYSEALDKVDPKLRDKVMETLSQAETLELAKLPPREQAKALKHPDRLKPQKKVKGFEEYRAAAGKVTSQLQDALDAVHHARADAIRLRSAKGRVREVDDLLGSWGTDYQC